MSMNASKTKNQFRTENRFETGFQQPKTSLPKNIPKDGLSSLWNSERLVCLCCWVVSWTWWGSHWDEDIDAETISTCEYQMSEKFKLYFAFSSRNQKN